MRLGSHPGNLALRFLIEMAALIGLGFFGASLLDSAWRWPVALVLPVLGAVVWGTFAVPGDPSRSGDAPVPVSGAVRLILELAILVLGGLGFVLAGRLLVGWLLIALILLHYLISVDRIKWLFAQ